VATAILEVKPDEDRLVFVTADQLGTGQANSLESFKRTQRALLRHRYLIDQTLSSPTNDKLLKLPIIQRAAPDWVGWIEQHLSVTFPDNSDIIAVSLSADDPRGLDAVVNAIVSEYFDRVVDKERLKKLERFSTLDKASKEAEQELRKKRSDLKAFVERFGHADKSALTIVQQNALQQYQMFMQRFGTVKFEKLQKETQLDHRLHLQKAQDEEIPITESDLDAAMRTDSTARVYEHEHDSLVAQIERIKGLLNPEKASVAVAGLTQKLEINAEKRAARRIQVRKLLVDRMRLAASADVDVLKQEVEFLEMQYKKLDKEAEELDRKAREIGKSSIEVEMMQRDVHVLESISDHLKNEVAKTKVEQANLVPHSSADQDSSGRVRLLYKAPAARAVDSKARITTTIGVGGISFLLPFVIFVVLDASKNRISTGAEVTQAVGLSVIGAVPILPQRVLRRLNGPSENDKYWRTLLSESVDSIAAVLLKGTQPGASRVIMVSSANAGEGKTPLAAHLAVSLAGAGRHPVLVDFDLRRPALHRVFGVSLQPGVNEILRDGHELESALQATQIPNLMMLSAGRTSKLGLSGLVAADLQSLFSKLRAEFDFVVVDACPILPVVDTRLIGQHVDAVLLSVLRDVSRAPKLRQACDLLDMFGIPMLGVVVTGSSEELYKDARYEPLSEAQAI
jgi:polysaccharide biosynthesis transport protein